MIGNHATWGSAPYFRVLARHTEAWLPVEHPSQCGARE